MVTQKTEESKCKKNFITPFDGWSSTAPRLVPLWGGSLLFTTKFPDISVTHKGKERKRNKGNFTFLTEKINVIELQSNKKW